MNSQFLEVQHPSVSRKYFVFPQPCSELWFIFKIFTLIPTMIYGIYSLSQIGDMGECFNAHGEENKCQEVAPVCSHMRRNNYWLRQQYTIVKIKCLDYILCLLTFLQWRSA